MTDAMDAEPIEIPTDIRDAIVQHAIAGLPNEACGVLAGPDGQITHFFPMANADQSPLTYRLEATEQLRVFNEIDDKGWELSGIVHSHTHTQAVPSPTDVGLALYPDALYLLVSLSGDESHPMTGTPSVRAWRIVEGVTHEVVLEIVAA